MSAANDLVNEDITPEYLRRRLDDWEKRVHDLYALLSKWLPSSWSARKRGHVELQEYLMKQHSVPARRIAVLELVHEAVVRAKVEPQGLWIIGANGRLDLIGTKGFILLDQAGSFESPKWSIAPLDARDRQKALKRDTFQEALQACAK